MSGARTPRTSEMRVFREPLIELRHVTVRADSGGKILDDVSLTVHRGEIFGLVFVHGIGKSTILRVASGFFKPNEGEVLHHGASVLGLKFKDEQRIQSK